MRRAKHPEYLGMRNELTRVAMASEAQLGSDWIGEMRRRRRVLGLPEVEAIGLATEGPYFGPTAGKQ